MAGVLVSAGFYVSQHPKFAGLTQPLSCDKGSSNPWWAAFDLSLRKGLLFFGQDSGDKLKQIYGCLYGIYTDPGVAVAPGSLPSSFSAVIPDYVALFGLGQSLFSSVLIFLFLLAVRNHFRIR